MTNSNTLSTSSDFQLSAKGLQNVACIPMENDFTFIVQFRKYKCNRFFAAYISPYVSRLLRADPNITSFEINIDDPDEYFKEVLKLMIGQKISITTKNMRVLHKVGTILGNSELVSCIDSLLHSPPDLKNCVDVISDRYAFNLDITEYSTFIAKNIDKIPENDLQRLKPELLYHILTSPQLKYSQVDWLAKFVTSSVSTKGDSYRCLIQIINLEKISHDALMSLLQIVKADDMNESMLKYILKKIPKEAGKTLVFKDNQQHKGILQYARTGLPQFRLTSNSPDSPVMAILEPNLAWRIQGTHFTITMDFGTAKVKPTSCYVNASTPLDDCRLLGHVDNQEYVLIHLVGQVNEPKTYEWQTNRYYHQLRFQGVRANCQITNLQISTFEIFGELQT